MDESMKAISSIRTTMDTVQHCEEQHQLFLSASYESGHLSDTRGCLQGTLELVAEDSPAKSVEDVIF
jgi:hypothetical protein